MTTIFQKLQKIGLTENQALVYLEVYKLQKAKAGTIIEKTKLHRNIVYTSLEQLIDKKLISKNKQKSVWVYNLLPVIRLKNDLENKVEVSKEIIDELKTLQKIPNQTIIVYEGLEEFRNYELNFFKNLEKNSEIKYLGISPIWYEIIGENFVTEILKEIKHKKIRIQSITNKISNKDKEVSAKMNKNIFVKENNLVSTDTIAIEIVNDKVAIKSFSEPYSVIEIINKDLALNYKNYFNFLWNSN